MTNDKRAFWLEETVTWCATQLHMFCDAWCLPADIFYVQRYTYPLQWNYQWRGLRPSVLGQDRSETRKSVLVLVLRIWSCLHHWSLCCVLKRPETMNYRRCCHCRSRRLKITFDDADAAAWRSWLSAQDVIQDEVRKCYHMQAARSAALL